MDIYVFVKADGEEVIGYLDTQTLVETLTKNIKIADEYFEEMKEVVVLRTTNPIAATYADVEDVYDWFDMTGSMSTEYINSGKTNGKYLGELPDSDKNNMSFKVKLTSKSDRARILLDMGFFVGQDYTKTGYWFTAEYGKALYIDGDYTTAVWTGDGMLAALVNEQEYYLEASLVKIYEDGDWIGNRIRIYFNEVLIVDYEDTQKGFETRAGNNIYSGIKSGGFFTSELTNYAVVAGNANQGYVCGGNIDFAAYKNMTVKVTGRSYRIMGWKAPIIVAETITK